MMYCLLLLCLIVLSTYAFQGRNIVIDPTISWRVVGGSKAPDGEYPHQISLRYYDYHQCGGSIINEEWVITAAHCVRGEPTESFTIVAGSNQLNTGGDTYKVLEVHMHESYNRTTGLNDVAILKVEKISFNDKVKKIAVERNDVLGDVSVTLSGWGSTSLGGPTPNDLQQVNLKSTSVEQCRDALASTGRPVEASQICTLTVAGEGACHGDSGGPLITDVNGSRKVVGIVSWGEPCTRGFPDVYARVSAYVDWFNGKCQCL